MSFSPVERDALVSHASEDAFDLLIIGGGITGAGVAHDAAVRGLDVALVEKNDFASGTSSRSSSLIHGGLRYLEQLNFKLVFEAVQERALLTKLAPHLVQPIPFLVPIYKGDRVGLTTMRMGLTLYESLAFFKTYKRHHVYKKDAALNVEPELLHEGLKGAISYYDCMTSDSRLTLETLIAAQRAGVRMGNYLRVTKIHPRDAQSRFRVDLFDEERQRPFTLHAFTVINCGGPWSDSVRKLLEEDEERVIRPTKGVHVVVPRYRLPVRHAVVMTSKEDRRIIFAIPWPNATVIGTTDTDYDESIDDIVGDSHDIGYLLEIANHFFPNARLGREDIISTWAGVRPLIREEGLSASDTSREHELRVSPGGLISILGGKLTTYRHMAIEVVDAAVKQLRELGRGRSLRKSNTKDIPLPGNENFSFASGRDRWIADLVRRHPTLEGSIPYLVDNYGSQHRILIEMIEKNPSLGKTMLDSHPFVWAEVDYALRHEMVMRPEDFLRRRTRIYLTTRMQGLDVLGAICDRFAAFHGWSDAERNAQEERFRQFVQARRCHYRSDI